MSECIVFSMYAFFSVWLCVIMGVCMYEYVICVCIWFFNVMCVCVLLL